MSSAFSGMVEALPDRETFLKFASQRARLISVTTALPDDLFVAERFMGSEGVSEVSCFDIDCLSSNAHISLKDVLGEHISLKLLLADGRANRQWHGYISMVAPLGADGGLARYRLRLEPWLTVLRHRRNSRIFQDKTAEEVLREVFADYELANYEFRLTHPLSSQHLITQYRETDLDFVHRLLASEGLSYTFEHVQNGTMAGTQDAPPHSRHTLVIFDSGHQLSECAEPLIRFHRADATEASDSFQQWFTRQEVLTNDVVLASWDHKQLISTAGQDAVLASTFGGLGNVPSLEHYDGAGVHRFASTEEAQRSATLHAQWYALRMEAHSASGTVRQLTPAQSFTLTHHAHYQGDAARFVTLRVEHEAANNLSGNAKTIAGLKSAGELEAGTYRNRAVCVRAALPLVPQPIEKPRMQGLQSAIVVGSQNEVAGYGTHSERDGCVRIQFPWQRGTAPLAGGLTSEVERATGNETNGIWVRVAETLAGSNWGSCFTPRVGTDVLVDFLEGDPDRPVIVAQVYNGQDTPPWPAGHDSNANHSGVLSGIHAPTLDGAGWSQWQLDDATGQLRTRLATSFARSELNLGYLIHQPPGSSERGQYRGQGFELRTDGWSITRAARGMLISTTARQNGGSTQLDSTEMASQLKAAHETANRLSDAASQSEADALTQAQRIDTFRNTVHAKDAPPDGTDSPDREVPGFTAPAVLVEGSSSISFATPQSTTLFAGEHLLTTVQGDAQLTAQHTASLVSGEATSLYTHAGGIKAIAANAPLSLQAHDGLLEVLADKDVTVTSSNDEIHVLAQSKIVLQAGQSSITLEGSNITFACPGKFTIKGASTAFASGASVTAELEALPEGKLGSSPEQIELHYHYDDLTPVKEAPYRVSFENGTVRQGTLDANGYALLNGVPKGGYTVEYGEDSRAWQAPPLPPDDATFAKTDVQAQGRQAIEAMLEREPTQVDEVSS
ncbi:type VI secretion system Vgr family protein [Uliginosibacterium sp. TH139]|uniref:type VI secretion system Vgr family protein n=1 Tax=Uliginosibacterium sp. TH139 TaxID=2067453 RepID=UPI000C7DD5AC|nr:type VI secretion system tip protein TssI/VgrG [Uliginosibacterium sp. TH139]PLK50139.1 type VI secretion system tip protein VgrG [Uliginosibacterium sp. TH139]